MPEEDVNYLKNFVKTWVIFCTLGFFFAMFLHKFETEWYEELVKFHQRRLIKPFEIDEIYLSA